MSDPIKYTAGLELWVWDSGELEGFALFMDGVNVDEEVIDRFKYVIREPMNKAEYVIQFAGVDGGATKLVDTANSNNVLAFQDTGDKHAYTVEK